MKCFTPYISDGKYKTKLLIGAVAFLLFPLRAAWKVINCVYCVRVNRKELRNGNCTYKKRQVATNTYTLSSDRNFILRCHTVSMNGR